MYIFQKWILITITRMTSPNMEEGIEWRDEIIVDIVVDEVDPESESMDEGSDSENDNLEMHQRKSKATFCCLESDYEEGGARRDLYGKQR